MYDENTLVPIIRRNLFTVHYAVFTIFTFQMMEVSGVVEPDVYCTSIQFRQVSVSLVCWVDLVGGGEGGLG